MSDLTARLQREKDEHAAAAETLTQRVQKLATENGELGASNASLEVDVTKQHPGDMFETRVMMKCVVHITNVDICNI